MFNKDDDDFYIDFIDWFEVGSCIFFCDGGLNCVGEVDG